MAYLQTERCCYYEIIVLVCLDRIFMKLLKLLLPTLILGFVVYYYNNSSQNHLFRIVSEVNAQDKYGRTALYRAVARNLNNDIVALLNQGADMEISDNSSRTPLHIAAQRDNAEAVSILLSHGANPNKKDGYGYTPLEYAERRKNEETTSLLLEKLSCQA